MLRDYSNGQPYTSISNPYNLSARAVSSGLDPSELSLDLAEVRRTRKPNSGTQPTAGVA
jgi:hypothetical protein